MRIEQEPAVEPNPAPLLGQDSATKRGVRSRTRQRGLSKDLRNALCWLRPHRRDLALIFLIAWSFRVIWALLVPPWQVPDEASHFTYTAYLVEQREFPYVMKTEHLGVYSTEVNSSLAQSLVTQISSVGTGGVPPLTVLPANYDYDIARSYEAPAAERRSAGGGSATGYSPLFYLSVAPAYWLFRDAPILSRLYALRISVAFIGAMSCVFAYLLGVTLRGAREWGLALGLAMAWFPQFTFISAGMSNDAAAVLCATALLWLIAVLIRRGSVSIGQAGLLGLLSALTILAKPTALPIAGLSGLIMFWLVSRRVWSRKRSYWSALRVLAAYGLGLLAILGPELVLRRYLEIRATTELGTQTGIGQLVGTPTHSFLEYWRFMTQRGSFYPQWLYLKSGWGLFGWLDVPLPEEVYAFIALASIVGITAAAVYLLTDRAARSQLMLPLGFVVAQVVYLFVIIDYYLSFSRVGQPFGLQGRYFFPILAPLLFVLLSGWYYLSRDNPRALRFASLVMLGLQVLSLLTVIYHYYGIDA